MKIAITPSSFAAVNQAPLKRLEEAGCTIVPNPYGRRLNKEEAMKILKNVDGVVAGLEPLDRDVLASTSKLKAIARVGIGVANIDHDAAAELKIKVSNTPDGPTAAVAEATLMGALVLLRGLVSTNEALHKRQWPKQVNKGLSGLNVVFVGYGRIGRRTADLFRTCGAHIVIVDPYLSQDSLKNGEELLELDDALKRADIVTFHAAGHDEILSLDRFKLLKKGVYILNSSRGELVNEEALCDSLDAGIVAGCWFDAFWNEPYTGKLCDYPQALLTPHACTYTEQCRLGMEAEAVENVLRDLGLS